MSIVDTESTSCWNASFLVLEVLQPLIASFLWYSLIVVTFDDQFTLSDRDNLPSLPSPSWIVW